MDVKIKKTIGILLAVCFLLSLTASAVSAFDVEDGWSLKQSNGYTVSITDVEKTSSSKKSTNFIGLAESSGMAGTVKGKIVKDKISFTIKWTEGTKGSYYGTIYDDDTMSGTAHDNKGNSVTWYSL